MQFNFDIEDLKLREGEYLASVMRKHWFVFFVRVLPLKFAFLLPLLMLFIVSGAGLNDVQIAVIIFGSALWMLIALMMISTVWTNYFLDIWIVTNQRIIDIEQRSLFNREVNTLRMETVQDVQVDVHGVIETFLDFGTLRVQTAGRGDTDAKIVGIPKPSLERDIIMEQVHIINRAHGGASNNNSGLKLTHPHLA